MGKSTLIPSCHDRVKELTFQKDTCSTLLSIQKEEATSHAGDTTAQAFNAETDKESSEEGSDSGDTELDYEDLGVLPDAEEATADDDVVVLDAHSSAIQTSSPAGIDDDEITNTQKTIDEGIKGKKSSRP